MKCKLVLDATDILYKTHMNIKYQNYIWTWYWLLPCPNALVSSYPSRTSFTMSIPFYIFRSLILDRRYSCSRFRDVCQCMFQCFWR